LIEGVGVAAERLPPDNSWEASKPAAIAGT
jgi:hypothetical protein